MAMKKRLLIIFGVFAVLAAIGGLFAYNHFFREEPAPYFASDEEHFLYGSIGTEAEQGIPYWIWLVLPRVFPDHLPRPGGYAALGFLGGDGHEMPIGLSKITVGFPRVGINCAVCHTASVRLRPTDPPTIYPAGPSHQTGEQEYLRFLFDCASDPRFTADTLMAEIDRNVKLSTTDSLLYRFVIIPQTKRALLQLKDRDSWMSRNPDWGRGRIDPFNPVKFTTLKQPVDTTIGNSDMVPVWNLKARQGYAFHWDGLNDTIKEVVLSSAIGDGATLKWVDRDNRKWNATDPQQMSSLRRIQNYIESVPAPKYPLPIDAAVAAEGAQVYAAQCASCHAFGGNRTGTIIPATEVGTDRHRVEMWNPASASAYNAYGEGYEWKFSHFKSTNGYVAVPLDGLWLRGPYLHNGSVPNLASLLDPVQERPTKFWRGYDVFDPSRVGFVSDGPDAEKIGTLYETSRPGNSNAGHTYGVMLPAQSKRALIEFLKSL
jgi:hypothetical protein